MANGQVSRAFHQWVSSQWYSYIWNPLAVLLANAGIRWAADSSVCAYKMTVFKIYQLLYIIGVGM